MPPPPPRRAARAVRATGYGARRATMKYSFLMTCACARLWSAVTVVVAAVCAYILGDCMLHCAYRKCMCDCACASMLVLQRANVCVRARAYLCACLCLRSCDCVRACVLCSRGALSHWCGAYVRVLGACACACCGNHRYGRAARTQRVGGKRKLHVLPKSLPGPRKVGRRATKVGGCAAAATAAAMVARRAHRTAASVACAHQRRLCVPVRVRNWRGARRHSSDGVPVSLVHCN